MTHSQTSTAVEEILRKYAVDDLGEQAIQGIVSEITELFTKTREEERERIAEEYGDYRYIGQSKGFGRYEIGKALRFHLLPHTKHKKGDGENL